jgi:hypothetical protein
MTEPGQELERVDRAPEITRLLSTPEGEQRLALIKQTVAPGCSDAEVGHFLELCFAYGLDPFAREAWCAKGKGDSGKLLIMVGRDGLRKIVQRNGCEMEGDVVHESDTFAFKRLRDDAGRPYHEVTHEVDGFNRGAILGSWARVYERATNIERGWFIAPLAEYKPANVSNYSPWSKQESVMILGAAERQAARQATPLSGLLVAGEDDTINGTAVEIGAGEGSGEAPGWDGLTTDLVAQIEDVLARADAVGFPGFADRATLQMRLNGQKVAVVDAWLADATAQLDALEEPPDAEVVAGEGVQETLDGSQA